MISLLFCYVESTIAQQHISVIKNTPNTNKRVVLGIERIPYIFNELKDKQVALVVNQTSVLNGHVRLLDTLINLGIKVVKIFCPEHGCLGQVSAGETVDNAVDSIAKIPIVSLYGKKKKPRLEDLENIEVVVFDIQDVGTRFYTYLSTMQYVMETCAAANTTLMLLDRPNPNGEYIDGPVLEPAYASFVGLNPIPIVHGMTLGELAMLINAEGWMKDKVSCRLRIIRMLHYNRRQTYTPPIPPSPNLSTYHAIKWYPSLCFFEGTAISVGRGTVAPFEMIGNPDLPDNLPAHFTPISMPQSSRNPPYKQIECHGIDLRQIPAPRRICLKYLIKFYQLYPKKEKFFNTFFNKLAGNNLLQSQIKSGMSEDEIRKTWTKDLEAFKQLRKKYLLYPD